MDIHIECVFSFLLIHMHATQHDNSLHNDVKSPLKVSLKSLKWDYDEWWLSPEIKKTLYKEEYLINHKIYTLDSFFVQKIYYEKNYHMEKCN